MQFQLATKYLGGKQFHNCNYSCDWLTVLYQSLVPALVWAGLPEGLTVAACGQSWRLELARETPQARVLQADGLYVRVVDPAVDWSDAGKLAGLPTQYPLEVQVQGAAFSAGVDALELLAAVEEALGVSGARRLQGRLDVAADFACSESALDALVCHGSRELVRDSWAMRARSQRTDCKKFARPRVPAGDVEPDRVAHVGGYLTTLYLGSRSGLQLVIYRKDLEFEGNTGALLHDRWRLAGWTGGPVVRVEARFSREWVREHWIGPTKGASVTVDEAWGLLGALWRHACEQYRLAPRVVGGPETRRHRPSCQAWLDIASAWDAWDGAERFGAVQQVPDVGKLIETAGKRLEDMRLYLPQAQFDEIVKELVRGAPWLAEYRDTKSRWRKYAHGKRAD